MEVVTRASLKRMPGSPFSFVESIHASLVITQPLGCFLAASWLSLRLQTTCNHPASWLSLLGCLSQFPIFPLVIAERKRGELDNSRGTAGPFFVFFTDGYNFVCFFCQSQSRSRTENLSACNCAQVQHAAVTCSRNMI